MRTALLIILLVSQAFAQRVTASWCANVEDDLAGYILYVGTSSERYDFQLTTTDTVVVIDDLQIGQTYYFVVKAFDTSGLLSAPSNGASITIQAAKRNLDYNNDGIIDPDDAPSIRRHYGRAVTDANGLAMYDLNDDNFIDPDDVKELAKHYGEMP